MPSGKQYEMLFKLNAQANSGFKGAFSQAQAEFAKPSIIFNTAQNITQYGGRLYKCLQGHTSGEGWQPDTAPSLWVQIADPAEEWPAWSQPIGAQDAYPLGAKVSHGEKHWLSTADNNVWEPGVYGWEEAQEDGV